MSIEQSIYTCVRARRDTGTTGFGFYSFTKNFESLKEDSSVIKKASVSYAAPRNQEVWWSNASEEFQRDREEAINIENHHPISFSYIPTEICSKKKAVFSFGKNLGRDIAKSRPGNMMVNMLVTDMENVQGYPFSYYGCPELFVPYDTNYFYDNGAQIAPLLPNPQNMTKREQFSIKDVLNFIRDDRVDLLCSMFQHLLNYNDSKQETKQIMICDKKENIILWIAALSLLLPEELAKQFSFTTYSFLATRSDDIRPLYENTMLCGVYTPSINGDEQDLRATNYDFSREMQRSEVALFDFEQQYFCEEDIHSDRFRMLIEVALESDISQLQSYHKFLMEKTKYRKLDNDYLSGYCFYLMYLYPEIDNLDCLEETQHFVSRYADECYVREIAEKLMQQTIDIGNVGTEFPVLLNLVEYVHKNSPTAEKKDMCTRCINYLRTQLYSREIKRDDYMERLKAVKKLCENIGVPFDNLFEKLLNDEEIGKIGETTNKKWILLEMLETIISRLNRSSVSVSDIYRNEGLPKILRILISRVMLDEKNRIELLSHFIEIIDSREIRVAVLESLYPNLLEDAQKDVRSFAVNCICSKDMSNSRSFLQNLAKTDLHKVVMDYLIDVMLLEESPYTFDDAKEIFENIISSDTRYLQEYKQSFFQVFQEKMLPAESLQKEMENIFEVFQKGKYFNVLNQKILDELVKAYMEAVFELNNWYDLEGQLFQNFDILLKAGNCELGTENYNAIRNLYIIYKINAQIAMENFEISWMKKKNYIDFTVLDSHCRDVFVGRVGKYLCECSKVKGTAFFDYQNLIDIPTTKHSNSPSNQVFNVWMEYLIKDSVKKQYCNLIAELIIVMHIHGKIIYSELVAKLHKKGIKYQDILNFYQENMSRIDDIMKSKFQILECRKEIAKITYNLSEVYEDEKKNSPFGKLISAFDALRKKKDE